MFDSQVVAYRLHNADPPRYLPCNNGGLVGEWVGSQLPKCLFSLFDEIAEAQFRHYHCSFLYCSLYISLLRYPGD